MARSINDAASQLERLSDRLAARDLTPHQVRATLVRNATEQRLAYGGLRRSLAALGLVLLPEQWQCLIRELDAACTGSVSLQQLVDALGPSPLLPQPASPPPRRGGSSMGLQGLHIVAQPHDGAASALSRRAYSALCARLRRTPQQASQLREFFRAHDRLSTGSVGRDVVAAAFEVLFAFRLSETDSDLLCINSLSRRGLDRYQVDYEVMLDDVTDVRTAAAAVNESEASAAPLSRRKSPAYSARAVADHVGDLLQRGAAEAAPPSPAADDCQVRSLMRPPAGSPASDKKAQGRQTAKKLARGSPAPCETAVAAGAATPVEPAAPVWSHLRAENLSNPEVRSPEQVAKELQQRTLPRAAAAKNGVHDVVSIRLRSDLTGTCIRRVYVPPQWTPSWLEEKDVFK